MVLRHYGRKNKTSSLYHKYKLCIENWSKIKTKYKISDKNTGDY